MKTNKNNKKSHAFRGAAALITAAILTAALLFTACPNNAGDSGSGNSGGGGGTPVSKYAVTFGVEGTGGTLKAKADGVTETETSPITVQKGKTVTFTATAAAGYAVKEWKVDGAVVTDNTSNTYTCTVTKAVTVKVSFLAGETSYTVKHYQEKAEGGYPTEPTETENKTGTVGTNAAYTPKTGGAYEGFTYKSNLTKVNGTVQLNGTIAADNSTVVELFYERNTVNVTFNLAGGNVSGNAGPIVKTGKYGAPLTAPAPVKTGFVFKGWNPEPPTPFLYPAANAEYTAQWVSIYTISFGVTGTGGTLKAQSDGGTAIDTSPITVEQGKTVTFTATAAAGYEVDTWTVTPISALQPGTGTTGSATAAITVSAATEVKVTFKKLAYSITFGVDGTPANGTLKARVDGNEIHTGSKVEHGKTVAFTAAPAAGYRVKGWTLDGTAIAKAGTNTEYTLTVTKPATITVSFEPKKALLTLEAGKNTVKVKAKTADGKPITVEGCNVNELANEAETTLTVTNPERKLALIGDIIELDCRGEETTGGNRPLIALDVSGCTALQKLNCQYNQIPELDVQGLTALQELNCQYNQIPELDVHGLTKLQKLYCQDNKLSTLNVSGCTALKELICINNQISELNVQGCATLKVLNCRYNKIAELNVSGLTELQELICNVNKIPELNVQGLTKLQQLKCGGNQLKTLDVQGLTELQQLYCQNNQLPALDVQDLATLQKLDCSDNQLKTLNVQGCTALKELICYLNKLNADAFIKIFNDLPTREASDGAAAVLYKDRTVYEDNCTDFSTPESLKKAFENARYVKHWKMQKANHFGFGTDI